MSQVHSKLLIDTIDKDTLRSQIDELNAQLIEAKRLKQKNRCKAIRRALRTRGHYRSRVNLALTMNVDAIDATNVVVVDQATNVQHIENVVASTPVVPVANDARATKIIAMRKAKKAK